MSEALPPFNPGDPEYVANPYPVLERLRAREPIHFSPIMGGWVLSRFADVKAALTHADLSVLPGREGESPLYQMMGDWLSHHPNLRPLMARAFTSRVIGDWRARIQRIVDELLDEALQEEQVEIVSTFAHPVPLYVIADMLGVPRADRRKFKKWALAIERGIDAAFIGQRIPEADEAAVVLMDYFAELAERRITEPGDDLISHLMKAEKEEGIALSRRQLVANCVLFFFAGHESTANQLGSGLYWLLQNPAALADLRADPSLWPTAVEEILRYEPAVQLIGRIATKDVVIGGTPIEQGQRLTLLLSAANRDPAVFPDPNRFDIRRKPNPELAFSWGRHLCLGTHLARAEIQIALSTLFERIPTLSMDADSVVWKKHFAMRGPSEFFVRR